MVQPVVGTTHVRALCGSALRPRKMTFKVWSNSSCCAAMWQFIAPGWRRDARSYRETGSDRRSMTGWWFSHPSEKYEFVNWDDEIPNISGKMKHGNQSTNQMTKHPFRLSMAWRMTHDLDHSQYLYPHWGIDRSRHFGFWREPLRPPQKKMQKMPGITGSRWITPACSSRQPAADWIR